MSLPFLLPPKPKVSFGLVLALGVAALLACSNNGDEKDDDQFREDVIWCEDAVAHLQQCCPGFDVQKIACKFYYSHMTGCESDTTTSTEPAFTKDESKCMQNASCTTLVESDVCARAQAAGEARTTYSSTSTDVTTSSSSGSTTTYPTPRDPVCP